MMKIKILSDLHIDYCPFEDTVLENSKDTVLILAGDIAEIGSTTNKYVTFIESLSINYKMILIVFGNHEYYHTAIPRAKIKLELALSHLSNVKILQRDSIIINDVTFIGATLWTSMNNGNPLAMWDAEAHLNDYRYIRLGTDSDPYKYKFRAQMSISEHIKDLDYIKQSVKNVTTSKTVVITHHAPCELSTLPEYKGSLLNHAFFTALEDYIYDSKITYWAHGHCHNSSDYMLGDTRIIANPRGYGLNIHAHENKEFDPNFIIEL